MIAHDGEIVYRRAAGLAVASAARRCAARSIRLASRQAVVTMRAPLVELCKFALDDPVKR